MNRLWIRLSFAFSLVIVLTEIAAFIGYSAYDWFLPLPSIKESTYSLQTFLPHMLADAIVKGREDELAQELHQHVDQMVADALVDLRAQGYVEGQLPPLPTFGQLMRGYIELYVAEGAIYVSVVSGVIGILVSPLVSRSLTAPLNRLTQAARAIGGRDLSQRVNVSGSREIVELARTFNQMAGELERAEKLRQNLMADVSHELRTPLAALEGSLRACLDQVYQLDQERIARLYNQTRHLIRLVNDLRELALADARQLPLDVQEVELAHLVQETAELFTLAAEDKQVTIATEMPDSLPLIPADGARLRQVLHNLLSNALRYTPNGGVIMVCVNHRPEEVSIAIVDSGQGIEPQHLARVFERFYRTDRARSRDTGGTGLGLAIVKAIVEAHGGRVAAASQGINQGSTFTLHLPLSPALLPDTFSKLAIVTQSYTENSQRCTEILGKSSANDV